MGVTSQSRASHHNNMKVFVALAGLVAVTSAYPMFLLEDTDAAYAPVYRVARQVRPSQLADDFQVPGSRFAEAARRRSRRRRTWKLQLMPHMAPRLLVALRSKPTEAPARARDMRCSPPGDITTLSPSTLENTTK